MDLMQDTLLSLYIAGYQTQLYYLKSFWALENHILKFKVPDIPS